jgi:N-acetylglucosamine-6-phosphate deacetylase
VRFDHGRVSARGVGDSWRTEVPADVAIVDARGRLLVPGFIDMHCHGAGGGAVEDGRAAISQLLDVHTAHGTTRSVLSIVTAPLDSMIATLESVVAAAGADARVLGSHLEGPFLDQEFRGAHDARQVREADARAVDALITAGQGTLRQVTIAPEHPGTTDALERFIDAGVAVAVGHTGADFDCARRAFDAGASILTHAFNGMRGIHHRAPGPVLAAAATEHVTLEVINDGVHVHPTVVRLAFAIAPGRIALITDAMAATGAADGKYRLGTVDVTVRDGVARSPGGSIAGSTLTQDVALRRAVQECGVPLIEAVNAVTTAPAAVLGRASDLGRLDAGFAGDAVLLSADLEVEAVWVGGILAR